MNTTKHFAEVIESSLLSWLAQSWEWSTFPVFGSLVTVEHKNITLFGIVHQIQTGSMDPVRYPFPYQKTEDELLREQPQIFEFLKTTFSCLIIGYKEKGKIFYQCAPEPPKIHSFVGPATTELSKEFFSNDQYLHVLFGLTSQITNIDELLLALIKTMRALHCLNLQKIESFTNTFSLLTGNDYRRLKLFLQRAQPLFEQQK